MATGIMSHLWILMMMVIMSGLILCPANGWLNRQCMFHIFLLFFELMSCACRMRFLRIHQPTAPCLLASLQGAIKLLHLLQQVIKSSTQCMLALVILITLPCAFLPILKGTVSHLVFCHQLLKLSSLQASESEHKTVTFQQFCYQLYHSCLSYIYSPLRLVMMTPEVVQCPDGHYH
jgi:Plavaka transposase